MDCFFDQKFIVWYKYFMVNKLVHLKEFEEILKDYHISKVGHKILSDTKLVLLVGPTSAGRNTIIEELVKSGKYHSIISDTTRKPRVNDGVLEQNGVEYWFRTEEEILYDLKNGKFLEAAVIHKQQVSGISMREIEQTNREGLVAINEIEVVGMKNVIKLKPDAYAIFVAPPSFDVWMKRLDNRGKLPEKEKQLRLQSAVEEYAAALTEPYYRIVLNDDFAHSVKRIESMIFKNEFNLAQHEENKKVIEQLLADTKKYLEINKN